MMSQKKMIEIEGIVQELIYVNEDNGYTVADFLTVEEIITVVGTLPYIYEGESLKLYGEYTYHNDYGEQFKVVSFEKTVPKTKSSILAFLSSGIISGVRTVTAKKIVDYFGEKALDVILDNPEKLSEIKGISYDKALSIGEAYREQKGITDIIMFLQKYDISINLAMKINKSLGEKPISQIEKNPYVLCEKIDGISFLTADNIAMAMNINKNDRRRIKAGIVYSLQKGALYGHTYLSQENIIPYVVDFFGVTETEVENALIEAVVEFKIIKEEKENIRYYLPELYNAENYIGDKLGLMREGSVKSLYYTSVFEDISRINDIILSANQKKAIETVLKNKITIITGGPGTGKTTIIKSIISIMEKKSKKVILTAPTGRAAKRMGEVCNKESKTIHRLLEVPFGRISRDKFVKNEENPLVCDMIIIDEMSMVDVFLFSCLLKAVKTGTRLVLVGDVNQLPSVGAGNVLKDIINSGKFPCIYLDEIYRQEKESMIITNAHNILKGIYPENSDKDSDFFMIKRLEQNDIINEIVSLSKTRLPSYFKDKKEFSLQVLTPMKKTGLGTISLNTILQEELNPKSRNKNEKHWGNYTFREGDKIIQTRNNYDVEWKTNSGEVGFGVFNGDTGIIKKIDNENKYITVEFYDGKIADYEFQKLEDIDLAYAITVHKSQGCEFDAVILPVFNGPKTLMYRNLLYTAVTRAKSLVVMVGSMGAVKLMVDNDKETKRYTSLCDRL